MRVTDAWKPGGRPTISFELFPPRSEKAAANFPKVIDALADLKPDFVSVTFGAGGSTREGSRRLVETLGREKGLQVMAYFAGFGLGPEDIAGVLDAYRDLGVENVLVVRGDPPRDQEGFAPHPGSLPHASDLLAFIRPKYGFCLGAAGYPEGHVEAESRERDLEYLKLKVDSGAEYVICNYCYDNRHYFDFVDRCRAAGIAVPVLPGVMPVYSVKMMENLAALCGATITEELRSGIAALPADDKKALVAFGVEFAARQCTELLKAGAPGLHFYTMDRASSTSRIVGRLREEGLL